MAIETVDAHHHLWTAGPGRYPMMTAPGVLRFYGDTDRLKHDFGPAEFLPLAHAQSVTKSVFVESGYAPAVEETAHVQAIADMYGFPNAILARIDPASNTLAQDLKTHMASSNFRGARLTVNWDPDPRRASAPRDGLMTEASWRRGYAQMGEHGLAVDLMMLPHQMGQAHDLASAFPHVSMIVEHAGLPLDQDASGLALWRAGMDRLSQHEHVALKISGLGMADPGWTVESVRLIVDEVIGLFGPNRCMFASNFPVDGLYSSYPAVFEAFDAITAHRTDADRRLLFHDTAVRIYRL